jgi:putative two-component system response regulator
MKILVAEDERVTQRSLQRQLEKLGHEVSTVPDGAAAWAHFQNEPFDIVVTDWDMPELDGRELIRRIRSARQAGYVYVIMLTGRTEKADLIAGMETGADDFLNKPFDPDELRVRLKAGERIIRLERTLAELNRDLEAKVAERSAELVRSRDAVIFGLAKLAESRDDDTGQHLERICAFVEILASEISRHETDLDEDWVRTVSTTAALHDIGKVGTPDAVLLKPGPLDEHERQIMQKHPCIGGDALMAIRKRWGATPFLITAAEIALGHHEKWDGSGYPYGLAGEQIPLAARIVALADVYDALTSRRVYKPSLPHEEAVQKIRAAAGQHFDPQVVAAFLAVESKFHALARRLR